MRKILLLPLIIPILTFVPIEIYLAGGGVLYAHGSAAELFLLGVVLSVCVLAWECFAVPYVVFSALKNRISLCRGDIFSIFLAVAYIFIAVLFVINLKL